MKQYLGNISPFYGTYVAGICSISIVPKEWLLEKWTIDFITGKVNAINSEKPFLKLDFLPDTYKYSEVPKSGKGGSFYSISLTGTCNNIDEATMRVLATHRHHQFVGVLLDRKHRLKVVGNLDAGMLFDYTNVETNAQGGIQQIDINMTLEQEDPAPFFGETEPPAILEKLNTPGAGNFTVTTHHNGDDPDNLRIAWASQSYPAGFSYILQRSTVADFSSGIVNITVGPTAVTNSYIDDPDAEFNITYYYRMKAICTGYTDSNWANASALLHAPAELPLDDLLLDLDSDAGVDTTFDGTFDLVGKWTDQIAGKEYLSATHKPCQTDAVSLGCPVISSHNDPLAMLFNNNLSQAFTDNAAGMTIYIVACQKNVDDEWGVFFSFGNNVILRRNMETNQLAMKLRPGFYFITDLEAPDDIYFTFRMRFDGTNQSLALNNGTEASSVAPIGFWNNGTDKIFSPQSNKKYAKILVYGRNHSPEEIDQVEYYLKTRYGHY